MKKTKRFFLTLSSLLALVSCASKKESVSIFIYDNDDTFIHSLCLKINERFQKGGYQIDQYDSYRSQIEQNKNLLQAIEEKKTNLLLVNLVDRLSASVCIEKAMQANTPLIFFNREPLSSDMHKALETKQDVYFVGANPIEEGKKQAEFLLSLFVNDGAIKEEYDKNKNDRSESFISTLKESDIPFQFVDSVYCDWQKDKAESAMAEIAKKHLSDIEAIVSNNDDMAIGAIDYCLKNDIFFKGKESQQFPVISVDGTKDALQYIIDGLLTATVKNDEEKQSKAIYEIGTSLLINGTVSSLDYSFLDNHSLYINGEVISKGNVSSY